MNNEVNIENKRKLASIQVIDTISPIEGADRIMSATLVGLGWNFVVRKDEFKVGDKVLYFQIDSILPEKPEFEFLRERKFRIKTIKLKKTISQGLVIPVPDSMIGLDVDSDVTELIGVKKHDPQLKEENDLVVSKHRSKVISYLMHFALFRKVYLALNSTEKGNWPSFAISKTDEERIQTCAKILMDHYDEEWYITEKLDGSSFTFFTYLSRIWGISRRRFGVCSRNIWLKSESKNNYWRIANKYNMKRLVLSPATVAIQGEICGPSIQKNKYKLADLDLFVFNLIENGIISGVDAMENYCHINGLKTVPILNKSFLPSRDIGTGKSVKEIVDLLVKMSEGNSILLPRNREGIVVRLKSNPRISFKVINPYFLLENQE